MFWMHFYYVIFSQILLTTLKRPLAQVCVNCSRSFLRQKEILSWNWNDTNTLMNMQSIQAKIYNCKRGAQ